MAELNYAEKMNIGYENEYSTDAMTGGPDKRRQLYYQLIQSMTFIRRQLHVQVRIHLKSIWNI